MRRLALSFLIIPGFLPLSLAGCSQGYSPNTYASTAAQQQATVERGVIVGVRQVMISPDGTIGAAAGGAAGGVAGAQVPGSPVVTAFSAIGGTLVGGISGAAAAKAAGNTKGWEYIVQETGDKLVSITQTSKTALPIGLNVLVIAGTQQARIVPDYTVPVAPAPGAQASTTAKNAAPPGGSQAIEVNLPPLSPDADTALPLQVAPGDVPSAPLAPVPPNPASAAPTATPTAPASPSPSNQAAAAAAASNGTAATPKTPGSAPPKTPPSAATP